MTTASGPESDPLNALRLLWLQNDEPPPAPDASALRRASQRMRRRVWIRNLTEWAAAALLLPLCVRGMLRTERLLTQLGLLGIACAGLYVSAALYRRGRLGRTPASASTTEFLQAHVAALDRQAQLLEAVWRWYLLPFVPGVALVYVDAARAALTAGGAHPERLWLSLVGVVLLSALLFAGVARLNGRAARALRREIAALSER